MTCSRQAGHTADCDRQQYLPRFVFPNLPSPTPHPPLHRSHTPIHLSMKLFSLSVVRAPPGQPCTVLATAADLSGFSFYQRGSVSEFMAFFSKTIAERTPAGQRQSVQENAYTAHVWNRGGTEQLAGECARGVP